MTDSIISQFSILEGVTIDLLAMASVFVGYVLVDGVAKDTQDRKLAAMRWSGQIW